MTWNGMEMLVGARWFVLLEDGGCQEVKEGGADSDGQAGERRLGVWVTHRDGRLGFTDEAWTEELLYWILKKLL